MNKTILALAAVAILSSTASFAAAPVAAPAAMQKHESKKIVKSEKEITKKVETSKKVK